eukprot:7608374-Karenia_brevis.AAC.1
MLVSCMQQLRSAVEVVQPQLVEEMTLDAPDTAEPGEEAGRGSKRGRRVEFSEELEEKSVEPTQCASQPTQAALNECSGA